MVELKKCPCCGCSPKRLLYGETKEYGYIKCACGLKMEHKDEPAHYNQIYGDYYLRIPARSGLELAAEAWNRRDGV